MTFSELLIKGNYGMDYFVESPNPNAIQTEKLPVYIACINITE